MALSAARAAVGRSSACLQRAAAPGRASAALPLGGCTPDGATEQRGTALLPHSSSPFPSRRRRLSTTNAFGSTLPEVLQGAGWEGAWKGGMTPWDAGKAAPVVRHLLSLRADDGDGGGDGDQRAAAGGAPVPFGGGPLPPGPVLVPGAGSGYDALEFARSGRRTVAVDIAPTAVEAALKVAERDADGPALLAGGRLEIRTGDFFAPGLRAGPWGVVFDYTFLCALPRDLRGAWAEAMTAIVRPGSELVCLIFPVGDHKGGPPFAMQPTTVRDLLAAHAPGAWEELYLAPVPASLSHGPRAGREYLGRYTPRSNRYPIVNVPGSLSFAERKARAAAQAKAERR